MVRLKLWAQRVPIFKRHPLPVLCVSTFVCASAGFFFFCEILLLCRLPLRQWAVNYDWKYLLCNFCSVAFETFLSFFPSFLSAFHSILAAKDTDTAFNWYALVKFLLEGLHKFVDLVNGFWHARCAAVLSYEHNYLRRHFGGVNLMCSRWCRSCSLNLC